jgi:hypothetical protein
MRQGILAPLFARAITMRVRRGERATMSPRQKRSSLRLTLSRKITSMETLRYVFLVFHLFGFAAIMGGLFYQLRDKNPVTAGYMAVSAVVQLLTGAGLIWARSSLDLPVIDAKMWVKLALDALVAATALVGMRNKQAWAFFGVGVFTAAAVVVAVAWT